MSRRTHIILNIVILLAVLAGILGAAYYLLTAYRIDSAKVIVEGNKHYTGEEIAAMVMDGPLGDNSLVLSWKYKNKKITDVPFVDSITVSVLSKDSIRINVYEKALAGYVNYLDHYIYFDKDGYLIENSSVRTAMFSRELEVMFFRLGTPFREFSSTLVRLVSTSSADAPG